MGVTAGLKLRQILDNVEQILAIELFAAAQGVDFRRQSLPANAALGRGTRAVYAAIRALVPFIERDTLMYPHMRAVLRLVAGGEIVGAVNRAMRS